MLCDKTLFDINPHCGTNVCMYNEWLVRIRVQQFNQKLLGTMRGIQINNFFNNHITLNGKKVNQQTQPIMQTIRPKLNPNLPSQDPTTLQARSPPAPSAHRPPRTRTNTLVQLKRHIPNKRSLSTERHRNATSAKKREELPSEEEEQEEDPTVNTSHRKLKPSHSRGGLGKRSKSTIIRAGNPVQPLKELSRKESRKETKKVTSNPTTESIKPKTRRKKSSRIVEPSSNYKQITKQLPRQTHKQAKQTGRSHASKKELFPAPSRQTHREVQLSKEVKKQKLSLKLDKSEPRGDKKSARTHLGKQVGKPGSGKAKLSKPVSAREKKNKMSRFIEQREKYVNQTILEGEGTNRLQISDGDAVDKDFLSVMSSLQKVLNSVGSKQKLKKELDLINEKLREFNVESQGQLERDDSEGDNGKKENNLCTPVDSIEQIRQQEDKSTPDGQEQQQEQNSSDSDQEYEPLSRKEEHIENIDKQVEFNDMSNPLVGKRNQLLGKRNHEFVFADSQEREIDQGGRRKQIELLKKFKNQSSKMMEKVGFNQFASQPQSQKPPIKEEAVVVVQDVQEVQLPKLPNQLMLLQIKSISGTSLSGHLMQDKYPIIRPSKQPSTSPRFDQVHLLDMISLKQQFVSSRHDKMSELVHKMFQKQLVSPKSYNFQLKSLDKKYEEQNRVLESLKKQAEQMSSMLSQIKKDKEQIQNIDQLIRNQQWEQAQKLVHTAEISAQMARIAEVARIVEKERTDAIPVQPLPAADKVSNKEEVGLGWQREQGWQRVRIRAAEVQNNEFVDIGVMTNRARRPANVRIDIDEQCGGTEESVDLAQEQQGTESEEEYIYYNEENEEGPAEGGLIRLVQVAVEGRDQCLQTDETFSRENAANAGVFHIQEQSRDRSPQPSIIDKNHSSASAGSNQPDRKGFTTNLYFIKQYCIALCEFVRDSLIFKAQFKNNVSKPLEYHLPTLFRLMRTDEPTPFFYSKRETKVAISELVWNQFNGQYESLRCNANRSKSGQRYTLQKEQELIFVRMIYDVLNESLDFERPGGQFGRAFPWREDARHLKNLKQLTKSENENIEAYDLMFGVAIARIIQWGSCLCGFLPDTVELENTEIDQSYVNHIRETRMAFLLEKMMAEEEAVMTNFQMQEADIMTKLGKAIVEELMGEFVQQFEGMPGLIL